MAASCCAVRKMSEKPEGLVRHLNQIELSRRWKVSPRTLERWRWLGQGPRFMKLGGRVAYRLEDVEAYEIEQLRQITPRTRKPGSQGG